MGDQISDGVCVRERVRQFIACMCMCCTCVCVCVSVCVTSTVDNVFVCIACLCPLCETGSFWRLGPPGVFSFTVCVRE